MSNVNILDVWDKLPEPLQKKALEYLENLVENEQNSLEEFAENTLENSIPKKVRQVYLKEKFGCQMILMTL